MQHIAIFRQIFLHNIGEFHKMGAARLLFKIELIPNQLISWKRLKLCLQLARQQRINDREKRER